jgi:hypothetical protein
MALRTGLMLFSLVGLPAVLSCGDETGPNEAIAGTYTASTFTVTPTGEAPQDALAAGASMQIFLASNGTTTGTLTVPPTLTGGAPIEASMDGTFSRAGNTVTFDQLADTFVRDATWTLGTNTLSTTFVASDGTIEVTLTRTPPIE